MPGIGDLVVNLSANTKNFDNGLGRSQKGLSEFGKVGPRSVNPVTRAFGALTSMAIGTAATLSALSLDITKGLAVGMIGVGAAAWGLQSRIGDLAGVADKAAQTGLSGAFLQQLEFAADQSGVSAETLTGGIKKLTVMIGNAADGSKEAAASLKSLGLSAKDLKSLSPEQQFLRISEAIAKIPTASGRAAAAVKVFGKSGIEMTTLFAGGLDDITKLMQDARDIGIGLDDKSLTQIAEADDALQKMYASIGAMVDQVAVGLAPAFAEVSTQVTNLIGPVTKLFETFNSMEGKWSWLGDTIVAAFDVGIETIKIHWAEMLNDLLTQTSGFGMDVANFALDMTNPGLMAQRGAEMAQKAGAFNPQEDGLKQAQGRLDELIGKFADAQVKNEGAANANPMQAAEGAAAAARKAYYDAITKREQSSSAMKTAHKGLEGKSDALLTGLNNPNLSSAQIDAMEKETDVARSVYQSAGVVFDSAIIAETNARVAYEQAQASLAALEQAKGKEDAQSKFTSGISSMFDKLKDSPLMGTIDSLKMGAEGMVDRAKIQVGALGGTLSNMFADRKKEVAPRLSGAMAGGSVDAYSTIVQAMMTRGKDPVVAATEKQTKDLIKGLKPKREFKNIDSFVSLGP
jgi:hypothetical protein